MNAPASAVWRALTEAEELMRWFPPLAHVEPGVGGSVFMSWGNGVEGSTPIEVWEPNRALRIADAFSAVDYTTARHFAGTLTELNDALLSWNSRPEAKNGTADSGCPFTATAQTLPPFRLVLKKLCVTHDA